MPRESWRRYYTVRLDNLTEEIVEAALPLFAARMGMDPKRARSEFIRRALVDAASRLLHSVTQELERERP